jgi:hypothetical protein
VLVIGLELALGIGHAPTLAQRRGVLPFAEIEPFPNTSTGTRVHARQSSSADPFRLRDVRACGFPRLSSLPSSVPDGGGVVGSSLTGDFGS